MGDAVDYSRVNIYGQSGDTFYAGYTWSILSAFCFDTFTRLQDWESSRSAGEAYISALGHDLAAPFSKLVTFLSTITKKWIIRDDSKFHNFVDGLQVVTGGIWAIAVWGIAIFFIVNLL